MSDETVPAGEPEQHEQPGEPERAEQPPLPDVLQPLAAAAPFHHDAGGWWSHRADLDVRATATTLHRAGLRLITVTARPEADDAYRLIYHWDGGAAVVNISTTVTGGSIATLSDLLPAADWAEREIRDYYGLEFDGRGSTPALMLRPQDPPGLFTRTADVARDVDPARSAALAEQRPPLASRTDDQEASR